LPPRTGPLFAFDESTTRNAWGRNLLLERNHHALTARTSDRLRISDLRGGAVTADDDDDEEEEEEVEEVEEEKDDAGSESEADVEEEGDQSEYDEESDTEETIASQTDDEDVSVAKTKQKRAKADRSPAVSVSYDEPLVASPFLNLYVSIGVMFLAKKVDLFSPTMVRIARYVLVR
jgi:hypothetical protein